MQNMCPIQHVSSCTMSHCCVLCTFAGSVSCNVVIAMRAWHVLYWGVSMHPCTCDTHGQRVIAVSRHTYQLCPSHYCLSLMILLLFVKGHVKALWSQLSKNSKKAAATGGPTSTNTLQGNVIANLDKLISNSPAIAHHSGVSGAVSRPEPKLV